ncbi:MAG TPA: helix-turn-helix domain-containing protein [Nitrospiria bacterium]|nr:helix-turn-helix domain-containing protein [Nitrospiria bacterium]
MRKGLKEEVEDLERRMILAALERTHGVQARAARELKISERVIRYKMKKYHLETKTKMSNNDIIVEQLIPVKETEG